MAVRVGPKEGHPTHHVSLSDGFNTIGLILADTKGTAQALGINRVAAPRTALQTRMGGGAYDDFERPWVPVAQSNWQGGRGNRRFETDTSRYADGRALNTMFPELFLGPQEQLTKGYRGQLYDLPGDVEWLNMLTGVTKYIAKRLDFDTTFTAELLTILIRKKGTPEDLTVRLMTNVGGVPGVATETWTIEADDFEDIESEFYDLEFDTPLSITNSDAYWLVIHADTSDEDNCWQIGYAKKDANTKRSSNGTTWVSTDTISPYFRVRDEEENLIRYFFTYKGAFYKAENQSSGAPKLYINGDRGIADANTGALGTLVDATKSWATNEFAGAIVWVVGGAGSTENTPFRTIVSNTGTVLTVSEDWKITHDTTTDYVIVGAEVWKELTTTGLTEEVTNILVTGYVVYFCQGDSTNIRKMRWDSAAHGYADDGTNKATFLMGVRYSDGMKVWAGLNSSVPQVKKADVVSVWATNMTFGSALELHDEYGKIRSMIEYGSYRTLYLIREGTVNYVGGDDTGDYIYELPLGEIHQIKYLTNGVASITHDVYLAFNMGRGGIERWYDGSLDDVGPNRDEGIPDGRQGYISAMIAYPGRYFAAINAGSGRSSLLGTIGGGNWHELYRAWTDGMEIQALGFQPIPGEASDRLWVSVGKDVLWLPFPSGTINPLNDNNYLFRHEGSVTSAFIYGGMFDLIKTFHSMKLHSENLNEDGVQIWMDYRVDEDSAWTTLKEAFTASPFEEIELNEQTHGERGYKIQYRLRFQTNEAGMTPIVSTSVLENIGIVSVRYAWGLPIRLKDQGQTLTEEADELTAMQILAQLDTWAETITPLEMQCNDEAFDDEVVFIDPIPLRPYMSEEAGYLGTVNVMQLKVR